MGDRLAGKEKVASEEINEVQWAIKAATAWIFLYAIDTFLDDVRRHLLIQTYYYYGYVALLPMFCIPSESSNTKMRLNFSVNNSRAYLPSSRPPRCSL